MSDDGQTHWYYDEWGLSGKTACDKSPFPAYGSGEAGLRCCVDTRIVSCQDCRDALVKRGMRVLPYTPELLGGDAPYLGKT